MDRSSLLICVHPEDYRLKNLQEMGNITPNGLDYYTIRDIVEQTGGLCIRLNEILNKPQYYSGEGLTECCFRIELFQEVNVNVNFESLLEVCSDKKIHSKCFCSFAPQ
jgi:hypothetical protein